LQEEIVPVAHNKNIELPSLPPELPPLPYPSSNNDKNIESPLVPPELHLSPSLPPPSSPLLLTGTDAEDSK
jgi:hypothetical protein